jgi:hypothetical protein
MTQRGTRGMAWSRSVTLSVLARPNSVADDDGESDPVAERGGHVRALVNEVPLSIDTPLNHPI